MVSDKPGGIAWGGGVGCGQRMMPWCFINGTTHHLADEKTQKLSEGVSEIIEFKTSKIPEATH